MDGQTKRVIQAFLALLVRQPPHITQNIELLCCLLAILRLSPDPLLVIRNRLLSSDENSYRGCVMFSVR